MISLMYAIRTYAIMCNPLHAALDHPSPPAHHPESVQILFSMLATSTARANFLRSTCKSSCPFAVTLGLASGLGVEEESGVSSETRLGEAERGVDELDDEEAG
jgi:hypothetical protein